MNEEIRFKGNERWRIKKLIKNRGEGYKENNRKKEV